MSTPGVGAAPGDAMMRTDPVLVSVRLVSGAEVTGYVHVKPDSYHTRVSDMLNRGVADFLPITRATMERPDGHVSSTDCMIVRREQIEVVAVIDEGRSTDLTARDEGEATVPSVVRDDASAPQMAESSARVAW